MKFKIISIVRKTEDSELFGKVTTIYAKSFLERKVLYVYCVLDGRFFMLRVADEFYYHPEITERYKTRL